MTNWNGVAMPAASSLRDRRGQPAVFITGNGLSSRSGVGTIDHDALLAQRAQGRSVDLRAQQRVDLDAGGRAGLLLAQRDRIA